MAGLCIDEERPAWALLLLEHEKIPLKNRPSDCSRLGKREWQWSKLQKKHPLLRFKTIGNMPCQQAGLGNSFLAASISLSIKRPASGFNAVDLHYPRWVLPAHQERMNVLNVNTIPGEDVFYLDAGFCSISLDGRFQAGQMYGDKSSINLCNRWNRSGASRTGSLLPRAMHSLSGAAVKPFKRFIRSTQTWGIGPGR